MSYVCDNCIDDIEQEDMMKCPICSQVMEKKKEKTRNYYWICRDCKISVEILYAIRDPK